jgi:hypothetical protein
MVFAALGALAIPLHRLTTEAPAAVHPAAHALPDPAESKAQTPALLRLKLLAPAVSIKLFSPDGSTLLTLDHPPAGESEHDVPIPLAEGRLDLTIEADLGPQPSDTALFLTVMPDALDPQTRFLIGTGHLTESWTFSW